MFMIEKKTHKCGMAAMAVLAAVAFAGPMTMPVSDATAATVKPAESGIAVGGYDVVAYFTMAKPMRGKSSYASMHDGVSYHFASKSHKVKFDENPQRYVPAYGGHCALGVRYGQKSPVDPQAWRIKDGRLYLMLNPGTAVIWEKKAKNNIKVANDVWPKLR